MELWSPPHDAPHLLEWWRPLMLVARRARADRFPWPVHLDEFRLAGRVARRGRPDVWIYEHHENGGSVCADAAGLTYRFTATPRSNGPGQFRECPVRTALWRARLPDVVEPIFYEQPPTRRPSVVLGVGGFEDHGLDDGLEDHGLDDGLEDGGFGDDLTAAEGGGDDGGAPEVRRRHLTLVAG